MEEIRFKRNIFEKYPWLNLVLNILVTILQITVAIIDYLRENYFWTIFFALMALTYLFFMIPMSYKLMKHTMQNNKDMEDLEKRIKEERSKSYENLSKL